MKSGKRLRAPSSRLSRLDRALSSRWLSSLRTVYRTKRAIRRRSSMSVCQARALLGKARAPGRAWHRERSLRRNVCGHAHACYVRPRAPVRVESDLLRTLAPELVVGGAQFRDLHEGIQKTPMQKTLHKRD
eukprot:1017856-Pleurochrysis_carterae.AAC.1